MSISDAGTIDGIGIDKASGEVVLNISDHLDWADQEGHLTALETKVNAYLEYLESGQLVKDMPNAKGRRLRIAVYQQFAAPNGATEVLERLGAALEAHGIGFNFGPSG